MTMKNLTIIDHPLIKSNLTILRDRRTSSVLFRSTLRRAARLMASEVTKRLKVRRVTVRTPLEMAHGHVIGEGVVLVPILRAGLGLTDGFLDVIADARVGHIGIYRDEATLKPIEYYFRAPKRLRSSLVIILDPMLATGGSAVEAITYVKKAGARSICFVCLVAAPEGVRVVAKAHPDVPIHSCALDRRLNDKGYILPGLGDAGDRVFDTAD